MTTLSNEQLREKLAAIEHERWADWMEYMFDCAIESGTDEGIGYRTAGWPKSQYDNWKRQIETNYSELSDKEKASDMEQVDRYWPLIQEYVASQRQAILKEVREGVPEKWEQNFYREQSGKRRWMCSTCNGEVFGGICDCSTSNEVIDIILAHLDALEKKYKGGE